MDYESHPNRPPSEQMVDLHVYVVPPGLWQERLHSAFNQIIGETVSAGFIRVFPESLLQHVRNDIERQLGYDIVPRNFVFCKSVGRCLTQVRSPQEKELKVKHFLPPHAYCPEIFVLDYDIARRSQSSSDGSIASNRSYSRRHQPAPHHPPAPQPSQPPPRLQNLESPRQTQRSKHHQRLSETTVYHGRSPKAHKGVTGVYIGPYPMQSYPGLGSRPGTAGSQSSGPDVDYEELERERLRRLREEEEAARRRAELERRKAEEEEERRRREEEERRRREEEERRRREEEERRRREEEERKWREDEEKRRREEEERRRREEEQRRREEEERRRRDEDERRRREEERRRREEEEKRRREEEEEERRRREEEEDEERRWLEEEERRRSDNQVLSSGVSAASAAASPTETATAATAAAVSAATPPAVTRDDRAVAVATPHGQFDALNAGASNEKLAADDERRRRELEDEEEDEALMPSLLIEEATSIDPQEGMRRERELLLAELQRVRDERVEIERRREDLIRRARQLQARTQNMRNQALVSLAARDLWKKRYFEEKKLTTPLEEQANRFREELESYHKRMVNTMTTRIKDGKNVDTPDATQQLNLRIQATRMQHEIEELQRRVDDSKMKLTAEVKLRTQAEAELRAMKAELTQRKLNLSMTRTQQMGHLQVT